MTLSSAEKYVVQLNEHHSLMSIVSINSLEIKYKENIPAIWSNGNQAVIVNIFPAFYQSINTHELYYKLRYCHSLSLLFFEESVRIQKACMFFSYFYIVEDIFRDEFLLQIFFRKM